MSETAVLPAKGSVLIPALNNQAATKRHPSLPRQPRRLMVLTLALPDQYPWVMLSATALPFVTSFVMGGKVMGARKKCNVQYPNLCTHLGIQHAFLRTSDKHPPWPQMPSLAITRRPTSSTEYSVATKTCLKLWAE